MSQHVTTTVTVLSLQIKTPSNESYQLKVNNNQ